MWLEESGLCPTSQGSQLVSPFLSVCLEAGEISFSPLSGVSCRYQSIPEYFFPVNMLVEGCRGQICFVMYCTSFLTLLPSHLQNLCHATWQNTSFQPVIHFSHAQLQQPAACPLPQLLAPLTRRNQKRPPSLPSPLLGSCCHVWKMLQCRVHGSCRPATRTCWGLGRVTLDSAPPCATNNLAFNSIPAPQPLGGGGGHQWFRWELARAKHSNLVHTLHNMNPPSPLCSQYQKCWRRSQMWIPFPLSKYHWKLENGFENKPENLPTNAGLLCLWRKRGYCLFNTGEAFCLPLLFLALC